MQECSDAFYVIFNKGQCFVNTQVLISQYHLVLKPNKLWGTVGYYGGTGVLWLLHGTGGIVGYWGRYGSTWE